MSIFKNKVQKSLRGVKEKMLTAEAKALITEEALLATARKEIQEELHAISGTYGEGYYALSKALAKELVEEMKE